MYGRLVSKTITRLKMGGRYIWPNKYVGKLPHRKALTTIKQDWWHNTYILIKCLTAIHIHSSYFMCGALYVIVYISPFQLPHSLCRIFVKFNDVVCFGEGHLNKRFFFFKYLWSRELKKNAFNLYVYNAVEGGVYMEKRVW